MQIGLTNATRYPCQMLRVLLAYRARADLPVAVSHEVPAVTAALAITASRLARTDAQRRIALWISSHDHVIWKAWPSVVRLDLTECPWQPSSFEEDREFLLAVIDELSAGEDLEPLQDRIYLPTLRRILPQPLEVARTLLRAFAFEHARHETAFVWGYNGGAAPTHLARCAEHDVYLHANGCIVEHLPVRQRFPFE